MKQHVELAIKHDCDTRWSSKCDDVEAVCMQIDSVVDALEHLQDNACENSDTRADAGILLRNILTYNFSSYCHSGDPSCRPSIGFRKGCKIQR